MSFLATRQQIFGRNLKRKLLIGILGAELLLGYWKNLSLLSTLYIFSRLSMLIWTYCPEASRSGGGYWSGGKLLAEWLSLVAETGVYCIVFVTKELS